MKNLKRILLVEDNPKDVELTLMALEESNIANEVHTVNNGEEALDYLNRRGKYRTLPDGYPVVILLDIKMPKMDGIEVLQILKNDKNLMDIPVVMLTSSREEQDLVESYKKRANAFVVKPIDFHEFITAIKDLGIFWAIINEAPPGSIKY